MDINELSKKYFIELWNVAQNNQNKYFISTKRFIGYSHKLIEVIPTITQKNSTLNQIIDNSKEIANKNNLNTLDGFKIFMGKFDNLKNEFSYLHELGKQVNVFYNPNFHSAEYTWEAINDLKINLNNEIINNLLTSATNQKESSFIIQHVNDLIVGTNKTNYKLELMNYLKKHGKEKEGLMVWKMFDVKTDPLNQEMENNLNLIKKFFGKEKAHAEILYYLSKRCKQISRDKNMSLKMRNTLINFYDDDKEKLEDYKPYFPMLKKYINEQENKKEESTDDVFISNSDNILIVSVDVEKLKSKMLVEWLDVQYGRNLEYFGRAYTKEEERITKISFNSIKTKKNDEHALFYINTKEVKGMPPITEEIFKQNIMDFVNFVKEEKPTNDFTVEYLQAWYKKNKLEKKLSIKDKISKVKNKI